MSTKPPSSPPLRALTLLAVLGLPFVALLRAAKTDQPRNGYTGDANAATQTVSQTTVEKARTLAEADVSTDLQDWRAEARRDRLRLLVESLGLIVVSGAVVAAIWQSVLTRQSIQTAKDSIDQAWRANELTAKQFEQNTRAWLAVDIVFRSFTLVNGEGQLGIDIIMKNVGNAVAVKTRYGAIVLLRQPGIDYRREHAAMCDRLRRSDGFSYGSLFPDQQLTVSNTIGIAPQQLQAGLLSKGSKHVVPVLAGCADYQFPSSQTHHQTRFAFDIVRVDARGAVFALDLAAWPPTRAIKLIPDIMGDRNAD